MRKHSIQLLFLFLMSVGIHFNVFGDCAIEIPDPDNFTITSNNGDYDPASPSGGSTSFSSTNPKFIFINFIVHGSSSDQFTLTITENRTGLFCKIFHHSGEQTCDPGDAWGNNPCAAGGDGHNLFTFPGVGIDFW